MDQRLADAARLGDVNSLHQILEDDPLMLKKVSLALLAESPLHVAALSGKVDFVKEMISLMPSFATQTNQQGLVPLHMASAEGHVEIVRELLNLELEVNQCLLQDNFGRTPLHYAANKGKIDVIEELIFHCPESLEEVTAEGETVLHLAVKGNQLVAVQKLMERLKTLDNFEDLLRAKDKEEKTVCELAAAKKQFQLLGIPKEDNDKDDIKEEDRITGEKEDHVPSKCQGVPEASKTDTEITIFEDDQKKTQSQKLALLIATIILTLTYQAVVSPPRIFLKNGQEINWGCFSKGMRGKFFGNIKALTNCPAPWAAFFLVMNSTSFLSTIYLMVARKVSRGYVQFQLRVSSMALTVNYSILLADLSLYTLFASVPILILVEIYLCRLLVESMKELRKKSRKRIEMGRI